MALNRIIPTRVGTRATYMADFETTVDHPHACGDKRLFCVNKHGRLGSSPRVWGQGDKVKAGDKLGGIIPTRVGTRNPKAIPENWYKDHPHACGDKGYAL